MKNEITIHKHGHLTIFRKNNIDVAYSLKSQFGDNKNMIIVPLLKKAEHDKTSKTYSIGKGLVADTLEYAVDMLNKIKNLTDVPPFDENGIIYDSATISHHGWGSKTSQAQYLDEKVAIHRFLIRLFEHFDIEKYEVLENGRVADIGADVNISTSIGSYTVVNIERGYKKIKRMQFTIGKTYKYKKLKSKFVEVKEILHNESLKNNMKLESQKIVDNLKPLIDGLKSNIVISISDYNPSSILVKIDYTIAIIINSIDKTIKRTPCDIDFGKISIDPKDFTNVLDKIEEKILLINQELDKIVEATTKLGFEKV